MNHSKILSSLLTCSMILGMTTPALAAGNGTSDVTLKVETGEEPSVVQVRVPSEIPISQDKNGVVTVADNLAIQNLSTDKAVDITAIQVTGKNGWEIIDYSTDISGEADGTKKLGLEFRGDRTTSSGAVSLSDGNWSIAAEQSLDLNVNAKLPQQGEDYETKQSIAQVDYTIAVHEGDITPPPVEEGAITNNWDSSTKMLPTGEKAVTFSWDSTDEAATITSVESSNPEVATIAKSQMNGLAEMPYNGTENWVVTAVAKGTATITATLSSGETTTFEVGVYELTDSGSGDGNVDITIPGDGFTEGDDLADKDITVQIPVTGPDGDDTVIEVKPEIPDGTELQPGDNEIEVDVVVDGVTIHITIVIKVESSNPSDGLTQTIEEAQAMGFTFSSYEDGLQIDSFENKQFKSEINVPEQIGDFKVLKIGNGVFQDESNLTKITVPNTVKSFGDYAFHNCSNATIYISSDIYGSGEYTFTNVKEIHVKTLASSYAIDDLIKAIAKGTITYVDGELFDPEGKIVYTRDDPYDISSKRYYLLIGEDGNYLDMTTYSIGFPVGVGGTAYPYLPNLSSTTDTVFYPKYVNGKLITEIPEYGEVIANGTQFVIIPDSVTAIGYFAFQSCDSLILASVPKGAEINKSAFGYKVIIAREAKQDPTTGIFYSINDDGTVCFHHDPKHEDQTSYTIPSTINGKTVTKISNRAFSECTGLTSITIPDSVTSIGDYAFSGCTGLTSITIPDSVTSLGDSVLAGCKSITSVTIPDSVTSIGGYAFSGCTNLTSVTIPESVTSIGDRTFYSCTNLESVNIPESVVSIGKEAFYKVPHIYYNGTASGSPWGALAIN